MLLDTAKGNALEAEALRKQAARLLNQAAANDRQALRLHVREQHNDSIPPKYRIVLSPGGLDYAHVIAHGHGADHEEDER